MKRYLFALISLMMVGFLNAQNLNSLTPEQLEMYKKYKGQTTTNGTNGTNATQENESTERTSNEPNVNNKEATSVQMKGIESLDKQAMEEQMAAREKSLSKQMSGEPEVFGSLLFNNQQLTFEPKLNIPTPPNYVLGTYDELIIDISGLYEANYRLNVSPEGFVRIPAIGLVKVSGQTIEAASGNIKSRLSKIYTGVGSGETHISIALGNIRSIRVTVVGEATRPGTYTLPSLATAFNALFSCGGPGEMGSMRDIKVVRQGKVVANIDMYRFLVDGVATDNISLQDEDVIKIEPYQTRITITGAIKHKAIFEALSGETLQDLIRFAGGFTENASKCQITAFRLTDREKTVVNVSENQFATFQLKSGDQFSVTSIYDKFDNRVDITGSIMRPGAYALEPEMTVKQLIAKADGLNQDAYLNMAAIYRKVENSIPEVIGFNLGDILNDKAPDILLQKNDSIRISNLLNYREAETVSILGAVKAPGVYPLLENISIKELIFKAKGFTEMASTDSVELVRIIKDPKTLSSTNEKTIVLKFRLDKNLNFKDGEGDFLLQNGDQVIVRTVPGFEGIRMVKIDGEVVQPGNYNIINKTERLSDLLKRAGGITKYAYPVGAYLIRTEKTSGVEGILKQKMIDNAKRQLQSKSSLSIDTKLLKESGNVENLNEMKDELSGTKSVEQLLKTEGIVGINLKEIMAHAGSTQDLFLEEGDILYVPRELQTVRVLGEVLFPTYVSYSKGLNLGYYISNAGGFSDRAQKNKTFVLYANGSARSTTSFLFFRYYPPIKPGSNIVVPEKPTELKEKISTAELVSIMSSIATVAVLVISVFKM
jgi:protein involved in polysaccharide export with SLBB domain